MITVPSLLHKNSPCESSPSDDTPGWSFLVDPWAQGALTMLPLPSSVPGRIGHIDLSSSLSRDKIRDAVEGPCFDKAENTGCVNHQAYCAKNNPPRYTLALGALSRRGFSPRQAWDHGVRTESRPCQPGFQSEGLHFQLSKSSHPQLLM